MAREEQESIKREKQRKIELKIHIAKLDWCVKIADAKLVARALEAEKERQIEAKSEAYREATIRARYDAYL